MYNLVMYFFMVTYWCLGYGKVNPNYIDLRNCKLTHAGVNFLGELSETQTGSRCRRWETIVGYTDGDFPDLSVKKASNFCRNPNTDPNGPWCYIHSAKQKKDACNIPLCSSDCRLTGPGMEYSGTVSFSAHKHCELWSKYWKKLIGKRLNGSAMPAKNYAANLYNYCRNPDGDLAGPWCYTQSTEENIYAKSYCDLPFCDHRDSHFVSAQTEFYSHTINIEESRNNISFSIRLWHPDEEYKAVVRILLGVMNMCASREDFKKWGTALELSISNRGISLSIPNTTLSHTKAVPDVLKATEYTDFVMSWKNKKLILQKVDGLTTETIYRTDLEHVNDDFLKNNLSFKFYSVSGAVAVWDFPDFESQSVCQEHLTFLPMPNLFWPLRRKYYNFNLNVHVRSFHSAFIFLVPNPYQAYPRVTVKIGVPHNQMIITCEQSLNVSKILLVKPFSIGYWSWTEFNVEIITNQILLTTKVDGQVIPFVNVTHELAKSFRWFSIGSNNSVTHWTFFCQPIPVPPAHEPDCVMSTNDVHYTGNQWVTNIGPCVPWLAIMDRKFKKKYVMSLMNYCRNIVTKKRGPWCYVKLEEGISQVPCNIRKCDSVICKKAGTANDYIGAWCYTADLLGRDLCHVPDCEKDESRIVLVGNDDCRRYTYILPNWRVIGYGGGFKFSLKQWKPIATEGIVLKLYSRNKTEHLALHIGANKNEKLALSFQDEETGDVKVLWYKTWPHSIPTGRWEDFTLHILDNGLILSEDGKDIPLMNWHYPSDFEVFYPTYLHYETVGHGVIGLYFAKTECHIENVSSITHSKIYPVNMWQPQADYSHMKFYLLGTGIVVIALLQFAGLREDYLALLIDNKKNTTSVVQNRFPIPDILHKNTHDRQLLSFENWTLFDILHNEKQLIVYQNNETILTWEPDRPLVFYSFSLACDGGWVAWTINCEPCDIFGEPVHGGWSAWSPWKCSANCGTGYGFRTRECNNPKPNIFGRMCEGPSNQTGLCNHFECGDISPQTYQRIRRELNKQVFNIYAKEGDNVSFTAPIALINRVKREATIDNITWRYKNKPLDLNCNLQVKNDCNVTINEITKVQSGTYICTAKIFNGRMTPIKIVVVAVETIDPENAITNNLDGVLVCKSDLQKIYSHLLVKWYLNDILYSARDIANMYSKSILKVPPNNITGVWTCVMEQLDLGLKWTVMVFKLDVVEQTDFVTNLGDFLNFLSGDFRDFIIILIFACLSMLLWIFLFKCLRLCRKGRRKLKKKHSNTRLGESEIQLLDRFVNKRPIQISRLTIYRRDSELVNLIEEDESFITNDFN